MIRINLLPQKRGKGKRAPGAIASSGSGGSQLVLGVVAILGTVALVVLVVDMPARSALADYKTKNNQLTTEIARKSPMAADYAKARQDEEDAITKIQALHRLIPNKVIPANVLQELGNVLSTRGPTMTEATRARIAPGVKANDPTNQLIADWDPTHVSLLSFSDTAGVFTLQGGALSKEDVTQLSKRLAASVYFMDVSLASGALVPDRDSGVSYYRFMITGKLAY